MIKPIDHPRKVSGCGDIEFPKEIHLPEKVQDLLKSNSYHWDHLTLTLTESKNIEKATRLQSESRMWHEKRKERLTASTFGPIMNRKKVVNEAFLKSHFSKRVFQSKPTSYGVANEKNAKAAYMQNTQCHLHDVGLVINPLFPFIGATPDAIVCKGGESGLLEVKCPYVARDMTISDAVSLINDFCLQPKNGSENFCLKKAHNYFFQVQGQLLVTGAGFCDFVVYTKSDLFIERIFPDTETMEMLLEKLCAFYTDHFKQFSLNQ